MVKLLSLIAISCSLLISRTNRNPETLGRRGRRSDWRASRATPLPTLSLFLSLSLLLGSSVSLALCPPHSLVNFSSFSHPFFCLTKPDWPSLSLFLPPFVIRGAHWSSGHVIPRLANQIAFVRHPEVLNA